jgi:hypothetical protein
VVDPELARGADAACREASSLQRWGWLISAIDDADPERAVTEARLQIAFYLTVRTYDSLVDLHGWQDEVAAIRAEFRNGRPKAMADHVTDDMLWAVAICGDAAQARDMLSHRKRLPDTAFVAAPSFLVGQRRRADYDAAAIRLASDLR